MVNHTPGDHKAKAVVKIGMVENLGLDYIIPTRHVLHEKFEAVTVAATEYGVKGRHLT